MKKITTILTLMMTVILSLNLFSQMNNVWVRIPNYENNKEVVTSLLINQNVTKIEKALPSSRTPHLQELYQINCNCDVNDLLSTVAKRHDIFVNPEIGPNYETLGLPNDYSLSVPYDYALNMINAEGAWEITEGDSSILISITDAGFYMDNYELYPKVVSSNLNFSYSNPGHGTAVATTAAGSTNNSYGKSSIGYNCSLDLRTMNYNALLEATYAGAKVINTSWASGCYYSYYAQDVINEVYNNGSIVVAAAGNGSTCNGASNLVYPASYEHVISVTSIGASNNHEKVIGNPSTTHQHNNMVDICAPGYDVYLTTTNGSFLTGSGSSFAAPYVSGTIGLMLSVNPCLSFEQVESILKATADTIVYGVNPLYVGGLGAGRLDAAKAVDLAKKYNTMNADIVELLDCETHAKQLIATNITGEGPYTIEWSNGDLGDNCYVMWESGEYEVYIKDSEGCSFYEKVSVETYEGITVNVDVTNVTCNGDNNGEVTVTADNPNYSYTWLSENGDVVINEETVSNLYSGIYWLITTDEFLCSNETTIFVDQPTPLETEIVFDEENTSLNLIVTGGTEPYNFDWSTANGSYDTQNLNDVEPGFYEVLITDANGCMSSENKFISNNTADLNNTSIDEFGIYPNPSNGKVIITTGKDDDCNLTISNMNGQQIINTKFNKELNVENLSTGIYIVTVDSISKKIVVQ